MTNNLIISVESRKGGVGKTTMALNLSQALINNGYVVLYLDCDITGTPITNAAEHSAFWKNRVNAMHDSGTKDPSNLLRFYKNLCSKDAMRGKEIINELNVQDKKINIISSDIYDKDGSLLVDPRHLMDDLNSYWLLDFLEDINEAFKVHPSNRKKAIVIDNSPGYVGLGKSVRNWLTSIGPEYAKFLLVSSLDEQDIEAITSSAVEISNLMFAKERIAKGAKPEEINGAIKSDSEIENFYYNLLNDPYPSSLDYSNGNKSKYIGIVFNKIPESLLDENVSYNIPLYQDENKKNIIGELIPLNDNGFPQNVIGYDGMISEQFVSSNINTANKGDKADKKWLDKFSTKYTFISSLRSKADLIDVAKGIDQSYSSFTRTLSTNGYKSLSKSFPARISPYYILRDLQAMIDDLNRLDLLAFNKQFEFIDIDEFTQLTQEKVEHFIQENHLLEYSTVLNSLNQELIRKVNSSRRKRDSISLMRNIVICIDMFLIVQTYLIRNNNSFRESINNFVSFINNPANHIFEIIRNEYNPDISSYFFSRYFVKFGKTICYILLRLLDCVNDYELVMNSFQDTLSSSSPRMMNQQLKDYIKDVVILKSTKYDSSRYKKIVETPFEMESIQKLLNTQILNKWSIL